MKVSGDYRIVAIERSFAESNNPERVMRASGILMGGGNVQSLFVRPTMLFSTMAITRDRTSLKKSLGNIP